MIKFDAEHAFLKESIKDYQAQVTACHEALMNKSGKGNGRTLMTKTSLSASRIVRSGCVNNARYLSSAASAALIWEHVLRLKC